MLYKIRLADINDIEILADLRISLLQEVGEIQTKYEMDLLRVATKGYMENTLQNKDFVSFIAETEKQIVAMSGIVLFRRPPYYLLDHCIQYCKKNNVGRVWLHTSEDGRPLYLQKGFSDKKSEMEIYL